MVRRSPAAGSATRRPCPRRRGRWVARRESRRCRRAGATSTVPPTRSATAPPATAARVHRRGSRRGRLREGAAVASRQHEGLARRTRQDRREVLRDLVRVRPLLRSQPGHARQEVPQPGVEVDRDVGRGDQPGGGDLGDRAREGRAAGRALEQDQAEPVDVAAGPSSPPVACSGSGSSWCRASCRSSSAGWRPRAGRCRSRRA